MLAKKSISRTFSVLLIIALMLAVAPHQTVQAAGVRYVKQAASGTGDCTSWANACILQTALTGAISGDEIWAMAGTYKPTTGTDRSATFQLIDGVTLYGGFAGTETARDERDPAANLTILSGDIDNNDSQTPIITDLTTVTNNSTNSYHVVTGATGATLDGFTITAGYASGGTCPGTNCGAGMFNLSSSPTLINLTFSGNSAEYGGGGMLNYSSNPSVTNATFSGNFGGLNGGGMENNFSNPTVTNVTFSDNTATTYAGGMANTFSSPTLTNVTFSNNSATTYGGGMENWGSTPIIRNTIFWGNTAPNGAQIHDDSSGAASMSDSVVQGGYAGTNILTTDPLLGSLGNFGGFTQTMPLLAGSSAIDTGNDATCSLTDQRGVPRPQGAHCDIGAFELQTLLMAVPGGQTSGLCGSWANACELRYALTSAVSGQEIWAAAGAYKPTTGANRSATFQLKNGVALYGGFAGTETARDQRDPAANLTILSGDIDNNDSQKPIITDLTTVTGNNTNSYNVVTGANNAILDGFSITAGYANGGTCPNIDCYGGGMNNDSSSPELTNIIFSGNWATYGGGMFNENSHPSLTKVTFSNNSVQYGGGGMFGQGGSSPTLTNVTFIGNSANKGGGMFNHNSSNPTLTNVTFSENSADQGGGLFNQVSSNPVLMNVTFSANSAVDHGGGMYIADYSYPQFRNTIFWGNTAAGGIGAQIYNFSGNTTSSDSIVQGGCADASWSCGTNIITTDPMLGALGDYGGFTQTIPLLPGSSAINTGDDGVCPATDQRGVTRPQGGHCDIGAFELRLFNIFLPLILR